MPAFESITQAVQGLEQLKTHPLRSTDTWDLPHVLHHIAQSVEYSLTGFPVLKPRWFRATLGPLAFSFFSWRGRMHHGLDQAIPGSPPIAQGLPLPVAVDHLVTALRAFEHHAGPLMPHFAYGALDKPAYTRAHLLHLADHWQVFVA